MADESGFFVLEVGADGLLEVGAVMLSADDKVLLMLTDMGADSSDVSEALYNGLC